MRAEAPPSRKYKPLASIISGEPTTPAFCSGMHTRNEIPQRSNPFNACLGDAG